MRTIIYLSLIALFFQVKELQSQPNWVGEVDKMASQYVKKKKNKGLVVGIIDKGQHWVKGYGVTEKNGKTPTGNTLFEIGSLTNTFTVYLALRQEFDAHFSLIDPINDYLPDSVNLAMYYAIVCHEIVMDSKEPDGQKVPIRLTSCKPEPNPSGRSIQFCDLVSHTSGIPNELFNNFRWLPFEGVKLKAASCVPLSRNRLFEKLSQVEMLAEPGLKYHYSQMGMALLGHLVSDIAFQDYQSLLHDKLLGPLAMSATRLRLDAAQQPEMSQGHNYRGKVVCHNSFSAMAPAVGLKSTAIDVLKFLSANVNEGHDDISNVLAMMKPVKVKQIGKKWGQNVDLASGWFISPMGNNTAHELYWQNGGTAGFRSFMAFVPGTQTAVVLLSNSAQGVDQMGYDLISMLQKTTNTTTISASKKTK